MSMGLSADREKKRRAVVVVAADPASYSSSSSSFPTRRIPDTRILPFGYDMRAHVSSRVADCRGVVVPQARTLQTHARNLPAAENDAVRYKAAAARVNHVGRWGAASDGYRTNGRLSLYATHSLGGLVCECMLVGTPFLRRSSLILAAAGPSEPHSPGAFSGRRGIVFLRRTTRGEPPRWAPDIVG